MDSSNFQPHRPIGQSVLPDEHESLQRSYHDSPSRDIISPPPLYISTEDTSAPASPTRPLYAESPSGHARTSREEIRSPYFDDSPASSPPPPPPPHRFSISQTVNRNPLSQSLAAGVDSIKSEDSSTRSHMSVQVPQDGISQEARLDPVTHQQLSGKRTASRQSLQYPPIPGARPISRFHDRTSYSSNRPFMTGAATPGSITPVSTPDVRSSRYSGRSIPLEDYNSVTHLPMTNYYNDSPYHGSSHTFDAAVSEASINPYNIADDGDDGFMPNPKRKSAIPMPFARGKNGVMSAVRADDPRMASSVFDGNAKDGLHNAHNGDAYRNEKSGWLSRQKKNNKKMRLLVGLAIGFVIVLVIIAGVAGGILGTHQATGGSSGGSINNAGTDTATNGDLSISSAEIQKLMNNPNLHKVFPGMDYTPWGVQYPLCMTYPPSQNNVTRDLAVLSQLTNTVRLYGTDCNQTEMVLHAIDRLQLKDMKIWLGVWVDTNQTTTDRQIAQMYKILDETKDKSIFKGAIIGNEALYRAGVDKAQSKEELISLLKETKANFTSLGYSLPVATSDLGDNWDGDLVAVSDYVMSNVHPFFAGVTADVAAGWTWDFWQQHDVVLTTNTNVKQIISETGWPSGGGTDCGGSDGSCASGQSGAVANIQNMNTFMNNWVCQALQNQTNYFWFEAFDEPWKVQYNTATQAWEDKWGLMDSARNLKPGIKIPSCPGLSLPS